MEVLGSTGELLASIWGWHLFAAFLAVLILGTGLSFSETWAKWPALVLAGILVAVLLVERFS